MIFLFVHIRLIFQPKPNSIFFLPIWKLKISAYCCCQLSSRIRYILLYTIKTIICYIYVYIKYGHLTNYCQFLYTCKQKQIFFSLTKCIIHKNIFLSIKNIVVLILLFLISDYLLSQIKILYKVQLFLVPTTCTYCHGVKHRMLNL